MSLQDTHFRSRIRASRLDLCVSNESTSKYRPSCCGDFDIECYPLVAVVLNHYSSRVTGSDSPAAAQKLCQAQNLTLKVCQKWA